MKAKLSDGFEVELKDDYIDDWEFFELLEEIDEGNSGLIVKVAKMMLGKEGVEALKQHLKETHGKASVSQMVSALTELMESVNSLKNSEPSPA